MYKLSPFFTVGSPANPIEVAIFPVGVGVAAVGDAVGDALGDGVTLEVVVAVLEVAAVVVKDVEAFVLVSELDP
jgi:hypothetical protein